MNQKIQEQFVPADIAEGLKEIKFNEPCLKYRFLSELLRGESHSFYQNSDLSPEETTAPLWQQVVDWFETVHKLEIYYCPIGFKSTVYSIKAAEPLVMLMGHNSKKEALTYAIKEGIKIVKNKIEKE